MLIKQDKNRHFILKKGEIYQKEIIITYMHPKSVHTNFINHTIWLYYQKQSTCLMQFPSKSQ
jgi:hypothetical protein